MNRDTCSCIFCKLLVSKLQHYSCKVAFLGIVSSLAGQFPGNAAHFPAASTIYRCGVLCLTVDYYMDVCICTCVARRALLDKTCLFLPTRRQPWSNFELRVPPDGGELAVQRAVNMKLTWTAARLRDLFQQWAKQDSQQAAMAQHW